MRKSILCGQRPLSRFFFCILLITIASNFLFLAKAQKVWTLDDCIHYALENNLTLKRSAYDAKIAQNNYQRSFADLGPNIGLYGNASRYYGRNFSNEKLEFINAAYNAGYYEFDLNMVLFNGFQTLNSIRMNYFTRQASIFSREKGKIDLILSITEKYYNLLYYQDVFNTAKEQYLTGETQLGKSEKMMELGKTSRVDYLNVKAQHYLDNENMVNAQNSLMLITLDLIQLMHLDSASNITIQKTDDVTDTLYSPDQIYQEALQYHPGLKKAEYQLKSSERSLSVVRGTLSPKVTAGASYYSDYTQLASNPRGDSLSYPYLEQLKDRVHQQVGLTISIPIWNKMQIKNNIRNAKILLEQAKIDVEQTKLTLYNDIRKASNDAQASLERYHTKTETVKALTEAFQIMEEKFNMGLVSSIEYGIAKNNLFVAQADLALAKYTYLLKTALLKLYSGSNLIPST